MILGQKDISEKVYIIAEIGNNHEGNYELAADMVRAAAETGVDAVKFQTFIPEDFVSKSMGERFSKLSSYALSFREFEGLNTLARSLGLDFISTPLDLKSASFLAPIVTAFKVASSDNTFYPLLDKLSEYDKPVIISSGLLDFEAVIKTKSYITSKWKEKNKVENICFLHCVTAYPVEPKYANLSAITEMIGGLNCPVGYSDHTLGIDAALCSVALGARIIEKHFTLDKNQSDFRDHKLSADPNEMRELVEKVKLIEILLGGGSKSQQLPECEILPQVRRSIRFSRDMNIGDRVSLDDLRFVRPSGEMAPGDEHLVIGKICLKPYEENEELERKDWV